MMRCLPLLLVLGCYGAGVRLRTMPDDTFKAPREVAIVGARGPVVSRVEEALRAEGVVVKRYARAGDQSELGAGTITTTPVASSRYLVEVRAGGVQACIGGGFKIDALHVEVVDAKENQVVMELEGGGYSEECPAGGPLFGRIARTIAAAWRYQPRSAVE